MTLAPVQPHRINGWVLVGGAVVIVGTVLWFLQLPAIGGYVATVNWRVGSAEVSGQVINRSSEGCSRTLVHLMQRDGNDAISHRHDIAVGAVGAGESKTWSGQLLGVLQPEPVDSTTVQMQATAECTDQH
jgi:hypothetical protein